jgi:peptide/nickel transport system ATP-binding protein
MGCEKPRCDTSNKGEKMTDRKPLFPTIAVINLAISYQTRDGFVQAVRDVSFEINQGETFGIVGESGCGKSTIAYGLVNFLGRNGKIVAGDVIFQGNSLVNRSEEELAALRGNSISMVYQDPMQALNPTMKISEQLSETLIAHKGLKKQEARERCLEMLERVYMPDPAIVMERYPHQLSGGQQQRVVIAMALLNKPALLIMDEPTTALDVTVEAAVLDLIEELRHDFRMSILFITHNLGVIARIADQVGVMYAGELVERAPVSDIFHRPLHPYTQGLIRCLPKLGYSKESSELHPIPGRVPSPSNLPPGCLFEPRCFYAQDACRSAHPPLSGFGNDHRARCIFAEEIARQRSSEQIAPLIKAGEVQLLGNLEANSQILNIRNLKTYYQQSSYSLLRFVGLEKKQFIKAVDDVSLELTKGATLGIVGESGCGKSTLAKSLVGLENATAGEITFLNADLKVPLNKRAITTIKELQMVFQNPDSVLNPSFPIGHQIARPLIRFNTVPRQEVHAEVLRLLAAVGLGEQYYERLPRQLSGGEKQRVGIARAIAARPEMILCDEPVSALDVSVQASILNLLIEIQSKLNTTLVFIAHDLSVIRYLSDFIGVMYLGQIVEYGPAESVYAPPYHPYTQALLSAVPSPDPDLDQKHIRLIGEVPSALHPPAGCRFHGRCPLRAELAPDGGKICEEQEPPWQTFAGGHRIYCHIPGEKLAALDPIVSEVIR